MSKAFFSDEDIRQAIIEAAQEQDIIINLPEGSEDLLNHEADSAAAIVQHLLGLLDRWEFVDEGDIRRGDKLMVIYEYGQGSQRAEVGYADRYDPKLGWFDRRGILLILMHRIDGDDPNTIILRAARRHPDPAVHEYVIDRSNHGQLYQRGRQDLDENPDLYYSPQDHLGVHPTEIVDWEEVQLKGVDHD